ncbi:MAG TPA: acyl carrier protein [Thermoleophilaceae bacterium]|jgi:acyl carrier protein
MSTTPQTADRLEPVLFDAFQQFGAKPEDISRAATLEQLGIDSLDMVEIGQTLYEEFGVNLEPRDFQGVETVGDALRVVSERMGSA